MTDGQRSFFVSSAISLLFAVTRQVFQSQTISRSGHWFPLIHINVQQIVRNEISPRGTPVFFRWRSSRTHRRHEWSRGCHCSRSNSAMRFRSRFGCRTTCKSIYTPWIRANRYGRNASPRWAKRTASNVLQGRRTAKHVFINYNTFETSPGGGVSTSSPLLLF